ncbi:MAG: AsmA family protein [Magnetococcales bacterium]|nr:AsmA family protein [Magnetococcales bacterium]
MQNFFKQLGIGVGLFLAFMLFTKVMLAQVVRPNDFKEEINLLLSDSLGRDFQVLGEVTLALIPWPEVTLEQVTLANPPSPPFTPKPMATIKRLEMRAGFWRFFLDDKISIGRVRLTELRLNLAWDEQGHNNWQDLLGEGLLQSPEGFQAAAGQLADPEGIALELEGVHYDLKEQEHQATVTIRQALFDATALKLES